MASVTYDGKVVVFTDATTSFARNCASLLEARGAKLVLNYPPTSKSALPRSSTPNAVNHRIRSVTETYQDLEDAEKIVAGAIETYGTVHALICNASTRSPSPSYDLQSSTAWDSMRSFVINGAFKVVLP